ncbi:hypothetical protein J2S77_002319 [Alkalibacillus salilacus]|uniref:Uncharacterized protein n=1 Tax=Alkalibacillus salilacus TaxID=284582 RepID=A0ABT9VH76_9BACI|nr:hypothetical protein [Alkalibacillus salilacus]
MADGLDLNEKESYGENTLYINENIHELFLK